MMKKVHDNLLVEKILQGDIESYRTIVTRHQARIFYLGLRFFHNRHDAEDFAQEVFLKTYEKLKSFQGEVPFAYWLNKIAYNTAVNHYHKLQRGRAEITMSTEPRDHSPSPEIRALRNELIDKVRNVLKRIPGIYRQVVKMHFFEGLSYPEISRIMSIPVNTIKSHIFRAKQILRSRLGVYAAGYLEEGIF